MKGLRVFRGSMKGLRAFGFFGSMKGRRVFRVVVEASMTG